ncbi:MAG TPA: hypothetical protein ENI58_00665 [Nitrospirae bacterium]|nr:hypothetical protein [Nitrospirota bacterium]
MSTGKGIKIIFSRQHPDIFLLTIITLFHKKTGMPSAYLYEWHEGSFDDPGVKILHEDERRFTAEGTAC